MARRTQLLDAIPPPLLDDLVRGRWLPIVGAGFSRNATVPVGSAMPTWKEMGEQLAGANPAYESTSPLDAISAYEVAYGRARLVDELSKVLLQGRALPGLAHKAFCEVPFETVVTTNFDFLLEQQYAEIGREPHPILEESQLAIPNPTAGPTLLKLHGDLRHPARLVLTEDDYDGFLQRNPMMATFMTSLLLTKVPVLIGFSLDDPDLRQLLAIVRDRLGANRPQPWAITIDADATAITRYSRRGVRVFNIQTGRLTPVEALAALFSELRDHWLDNVARLTVPPDARLAEISQVPEPSALCVVIAPFRLVRFYVDQIFPAIESTGLVPVSPALLLSPQGSGTAATEALIARASAVVIDLGDGTGWFDLRIARSRRPDAQIVLITSDSAYLPRDAITSFDLVLRNADPVPEAEQLAEQIRSRLTFAGEQAEGQWTLEIQRLLDIGAGGPAVVSAFALLESRLRDRFGFGRGKFGRPGTLPNMLQVAASEELVDQSTVTQLRADWKIRNQIVHDNANVTAGRTRSIVSRVLDAVRQIDLTG
jgi:hypothetical protein